MEARAEGCLYGSDWPHTETDTPPQPSADWLALLRTTAGHRWASLGQAAKRLYAGA